MSLSKISRRKRRFTIAVTIGALFLILSITIAVLSAYLVRENDWDIQELLLTIDIELPKIDFNESKIFKNKSIEDWINPVTTIIRTNTSTSTSTTTIQYPTTLQISTTTLIEQDLTNQTTTTMSPTATTIGQHTSTNTTTLTSSTSTSTTIQSTTSTTLTSTTTLTSSTPTSTTTVTTSLRTIQLVLVYPSHGLTTTGKNITFSYTPYSANILSNCSIYLTLNGSWDIGGIDTTIFNNKSNTFSFFNMKTGTYSWNIGCSTVSGEREFGMFNNTFIIF